MPFRLAALAVLMVPLAASAHEPALSLQELSDREEIRALLLEYGRSFDERRLEDYAALFAPDGEWVGGAIAARGPAEVLAMIERIVANIPTAPGKRNFHVMTNMMVDVDGDRATAWSRYTFYMPGPDGAPEPVVTGVYEDQLARTDGGWRFLRRQATADNAMARESSAE